MDNDSEDTESDQIQDNETEEEESEEETVQQKLNRTTNLFRVQGIYIFSVSVNFLAFHY